MSKLHAQAHALARYLHVVYMYIAQHNTVFLCINMDIIVDIPAVSSLARVLHHPSLRQVVVYTNTPME